MKPIIFNTEMVRAILDERKTQTRRIIKNKNWPVPIADGFEWCFHETKDGSFEIGAVNKSTGEGSVHSYIKCPYGKPGDLLWVRETWAMFGMDFIYKSECDGNEKGFKWKPSIHMPRSACRLFLKIKDIRVERVQDISEKDSGEEGISQGQAWGEGLSYKEIFRKLWNSINEKRGFGWDVNPWVWVVEFERTEES